MSAVPVVVARIYDESGRVLISKRLPGKQFGGMWEFPGGKVEPKDATLQAAVVREIQEELRIIVSPSPDYIYRRVETDKGAYDLYYFDCSVTSGEPEAFGCVEFAWVDIPNLIEYDLCPMDSDLAAEMTKKSLAEGT